MRYSSIAIFALIILLQSCGGSQCEMDEQLLSENKLDESFCPEIDTTVRPLPTPIINKVNIFFDASGSMVGFMPTTKPSSQFQVLIPDIISKLATEFSGEVNFYPIYNSNTSLKNLAANDAMNKIIYGTLVENGGNTYIPTMLDSIYSGHFDSDAVNIFISDGIYSPKKGEEKQAEQATREIREKISNYTKQYSTSVFCLFSQFNKIPNSPYYLMIFGKPENNHHVESIVVDAIANKNQEFHQANFGLQYDRPFYSVLPYTENSPNCISNPCTNLKDAFANVSVQNWNAENDSISFWVAVNLKELPTYATTQSYLDSNMVIAMQKGTAKITSIASTAPRGIDKDDKSIAEKSTHFVRIRISNLEDCATTITVGLKYSTPYWIGELNQTTSESNGDKTFGLERMMNGFSEAYKQNKPTYFFNNIIVSIIKQ